MFSVPGTGRSLTLELQEVGKRKHIVMFVFPANVFLIYIQIIKSNLTKMFVDRLS